MFLQLIMLQLMMLILLINPSILTQLNCVGNSHSNGNCIINCSTQNCEKKLVDGKHYKSLSILCINNPNDSTCDKMKIFCPINGICSLNCELENGCTNMHILSDGSSSELHIDCGQYSCSNITVNGSSIKVLEITAIGPNSLSESHIFAEHVSKFRLNCGAYDINSKDACLQNNLYLPSIMNHSSNMVSINCYGESCRGSSIHVLDGMDGININTLSNCECDDDISKCSNYWYLFCDEHYRTAFGYITFRDYQCLTDNITKCDCDIMQQYVLDNFKNKQNDENIVCNDNNNNNQNVTAVVVVQSTEQDLWTTILNKMNNQEIWSWIVLAVTFLIVLVLFCYLCAMKMSRYNEIQLIRTFDPDEFEQNHIENNNNNINNNVMISSIED